jgi:hypothetical protein
MAVKPGFGITPTTRRELLWSSAADIARIIVEAIDKRQDQIALRPGFWRWILLFIRLVPTSILHKATLWSSHELAEPRGPEIGSRRCSQPHSPTAPTAA